MLRRDGAVPLRQPRHRADAREVGIVETVTVLAPGWLAKLYPDGDTLTIDVESGVLDDSFSLETEFDCRFVLRAPQSR